MAKNLSNTLPLFFKDDYTAIDKRSIISPIDFGSKLINNHNTLWWGNKEDENGLKYSILEHTVFLDDSRLERK